VSLLFCEGGLQSVERLYFCCRVRLNGADTFVVWYEDERDGFVHSSDGRLAAAASRDALATVIAKMGISLVPDDCIAYDFDRLKEWCLWPTAEGVECSKFLNAWNFFDDLGGLYTDPASAFAQLSRESASCYDKLFWGNNLPSVTPPGERFEPSWLPEDLEAMRGIFEAGLLILGTGLAGSAPQ
jgi:hypothetical protein